MLFQTYQPIEAGKINVTMTTLARLAEGFEVDIAELLAVPRRRRATPSEMPQTAVAEKTSQRAARRVSKRSD
jgi:transcriptional regulator with XRE-family HTH domain